MAFDEEIKNHRIKFVKRKQEADEIEWFFNQLRKQEARPEIVEAMIEIGDRRIAKGLWDIIISNNIHPWLMQRSLYIIQSLTGGHVDYLSSERASLNESQLQYIKQELIHLFGKGLFSRKQRAGKNN